MNDEPPDGLPGGWALPAIEDVCVVTQGQSPPGDTYNTTEDGIPFLQGKAEFGDVYPTPVKWCTAPKKLAEPEDVLISIRAPVGSTNLARTKCCIGRGLAAIRPLAGAPSRYFLYALRGTVAGLRSKATGSTFEAISGRDLRSHRIPIAPLPEQHRIVAEIENQFTRLDAAVDALESAQVKLKRYRASVLKAACEGRLVPTEAELAHAEGRDYEPAAVLLERVLQERLAKWEADQLEKMGAAGRQPNDDRWKAKYKEPSPPAARTLPTLPTLPEGWTWTTVEQVASPEERSVQSGPFGSALLHSEFQATGILAIGIDNVLDGRFSMGDQNRISENKFQSLQKFQARPLDVLVTVMATVGRCCVVPFNLEPALITKHVYRVSSNQELVSPEYLMFSLWGAKVVRQQMFREVKGQTRAGINGEILRRIVLPLPPLAEQHRIVESVERRLSGFDQLAATLILNNSCARRLRQSILKRAFEGKLVGQDPNDEPASVLLERIRTERKEEAAQAIPRRKRRAGRETT